MHDLVLRNGSLFDGERLLGTKDIGITGGRISSIGEPGPQGLREYDMTGLLVTPGFIDIHTHATISQLRSADGANMLSQGVTTIVTGNCGNSEIATAPEDVLSYFRRIRDSRPSVNVAALLGHNTLRDAVLGPGQNREATRRERETMVALVAEVLSEGAVGLSSGLMYPSGKYAAASELVGLLAPVARRGGIYATHMRDEGDRLIDSVTESLRTADQADVRLQISHLKATGRQNEGKTLQALDVIRSARLQFPVRVDVYLFDAASSKLSILLPDALHKRYAVNGDIPLDRQHLLSQEEKGLQNLCSGGWEDVFVADHADRSYIGESIASIAGGSSDPAEAYFRVLKADPLSRGVFRHIMSFKDIDAVVSDPLSIIASDGYLLDTCHREFIHPRSYGNVSTFLAQYVKNGKLPLEEGLRKLTSIPGDAFALGRGRITVGSPADLAVLAPDAATYPGSYANPCLLSSGVSYVFINGQLAWDGATKGRHGTFIGGRDG